MADQSREDAQRFVTVIVPRLVGVGGLLVYLLTLNHWVSLQSLGTVARLCGWLWQPAIGQPLSFILLYPFGWLPEAWVPLALNLFQALCAALVLTLLARSVALLPYNTAPAGQLRPAQPAAMLAGPTTWMPPVLAALLCGLQLSFWEHATCGSGEMINLLVFATVIWCLLEFRVDRRQCWLSVAALVYAAGMTNNWSLVGYLPVFVAAMLWTKGLGPFLELRFLGRMCLWGLAGLSLYLLLPALHSLAPHDQVGFWAVLKAHLKSQRMALALLRSPALRPLFAVSLVPVLVLCIRWRSHSVQFGDDSRLGVFLTKATAHFLHGLLWVSSLWLALDPTFGPRHLGLGTPMLSYYYLSAIIFGYCTGYFIGPRKPSSAPTGFQPGITSVFWYRLRTRCAARLPAPLRQRLRRDVLAPVAGGVLVVVLPLLLGWRNLGSVLLSNGLETHTLARECCQDLPPGQCMVLSDDPRRLFLVHAELARRHYDKEPVLLETAALASVPYQRFVASKSKGLWPLAAPTNRAGVLPPGKLLEWVGDVVARQPVVILHPDFGFFFERFTDRPSGFAHQLVPRPVGDAAQAPPPEAAVAANEQLWQQRWKEHLAALAQQTKPRPEFSPRWRWIRLANEPNATAAVLGAAYSKSLNDWGVRLQRLGRWSEAGVWFARALELNPDNFSAAVNAEYNTRHRRDEQARLSGEVLAQLAGGAGKFDSWRGVLNANGPVDQPAFLFKTGQFLLGEGYSRQAKEAFARCGQLAPNWLAPKLWLARSHLERKDYALALTQSEGLETLAQPQNGPALAQLLVCRARALRGLGRTNEAAACVESFVSRYQQHTQVLVAAADLYLQGRQPQRELAVILELLRRDPQKPELLARKASIELELGRYDDAIATLTSVLSITPSEKESRLHRAVAYLSAGNLPAAQADYQQLLDKPGYVQAALFGLGAVAWRQQDTNAAIRYYQQFLAKASAESDQYKLASERLRQLGAARRD